MICWLCRTASIKTSQCVSISLLLDSKHPCRMIGNSFLKMAELSIKLFVPVVMSPQIKKKRVTEKKKLNVSPSKTFTSLCVDKKDTSTWMFLPPDLRGRSWKNLLSSWFIMQDCKSSIDTSFHAPVPGDKNRPRETAKGQHVVICSILEFYHLMVPPNRWKVTSV